MSIDQKNIKNILAVRNDRFGEFLLNIPAFRALKETFIDAKMAVAIDPYARELAENMPFIDKTIEWGREKHSLSAKLSLVSLLKKDCFDMAIMLNPSKDFNIFTYLAGIPIRVGYDRKWGFLLTHKIKDKKALGEKHEVEYNLELVSLIGAKTEDKALSLMIDENVVDNSIAIHPFTSDPIKQWPQNNFCELTKRLVKETDMKIIIIGGKEKLSESIGLYDDASDKIVNLTGKTTLMQLAVLLKKCKLLISGDSGPVHLACAVGTPVIALFRSDIPGKAAKRWGPWGGRHSVIEKASLSDISVDEVLNKAKEVIRR